jgi:8-oxo-dGTP pyrophosphatase MutT (NUDIX family)
MKSLLCLLKKTWIRSFSSETRIDHLKKLFEPFHNPNSYKECVLKNEQISLLKRASVLVLLSYNKKTQEYEYTLTKRTSNLRNHSGQISFVGGMRDEIDKNEIKTAYREAYEEIGIGENQLSLIAQIYPITTSNGVLVTPIVAYYDDYNFNPVINQNEVEFIFKIPTKRFLSKKNHHSKRLQKFYVHSFSDEIDEKALNVWGFTAMVCICVSSVIHKQNPDFEIDPVEKYSFDKLDEFLKHYLLVKSKPLINSVLKHPKETNIIIKSLL